MKKSTVKSIAAVSVLGAAAIALGAVSSWFTNWNAKTWFNHWGQGAPIAVDVDTTKTDSSSLKVSRSGISYDSEDAELVATVPRYGYVGFDMSRTFNSRTDTYDYEDFTSYKGFPAWNVKMFNSFGDSVHVSFPVVESLHIKVINKSGTLNGVSIAPYYTIGEYDCIPVYPALQSESTIGSYTQCYINQQDVYSLLDEAGYDGFCEIEVSIPADENYLASPVFAPSSCTNWRNTFVLSYCANPNLDMILEDTSVKIPLWSDMYGLDGQSTNQGTTAVPSYDRLGYGIDVSYFSNGSWLVIEDTSEFLTFDKTTGVYTIDFLSSFFSNSLKSYLVTIYSSHYLSSASTFNVDFVRLNYDRNNLPSGISASDHGDLVFSFYFNFSQLASPSNFVLDKTSLNWDLVHNAKGYALFLGSDIAPIWTTTDSTCNSLNLSELKTDFSTSQLFRLRALGNIGKQFLENSNVKLSAYNASNTITYMTMLNFVIDGETLNKFVPLGSSIGDSLSDVVVPGKTFSGWYYDSGYTNAVSETDIVNTDTTIYARLTDAPIQESSLSWWDSYKWYVLIPSISVAALGLISGIGFAVKKHK